MPRVSLTAPLVGWATASFVTSLLVGLTIASAGDALGLWTVTMLASYGAIFCGFLTGGYAAGRMRPESGARQGVAIFAFTVLATLAGSALSIWRGDPRFSQMLSPFAISWWKLDAMAASGLLFVAFVMAAGATLGAEAGARGFRQIRFGKVKSVRAR
jgi:hypothetical protein